MSTTTAPAPPSTLPADYASLADRFRPLFARIADGALARELDRRLPFDEVKALDEAGFGALRVPVEHGGPGVTIETFTRLLIDLAEADSNIAHLYRSHTGFLEALRFQSERIQDAWYPRVLAGATVGNASTEKGGNPLGGLSTVLTGAAGSWRLTGQKFYSTGTIFSAYTRVSASLDGRDGRRFAVVATDAPGVRVDDDWDGFGQKLTGTGTTTFDAVPVDDDAVFDRITDTAEAVHEAAFFQLVLLAVLAGIARASRRDAAVTISSRKRTFNTGLGLPFREDPLIQEATGRIAAKAYAAEATVLQTARVLDAGIEAATASGAVRADFTGPVPEAVHASEIAVEHAQVTVPELALGAAQDLFLTVGASATSTAKGLDRHWRNAQTVATHNPISFRARAIGDYWINGTLPTGLNAIGDAKPTTAGRDA
ncbi:acyl-CoA dehydrogenase family protein [Brevibacterium jeotgali]|uniref:Acyl-CoA dehydrogenase n=1 Tax=Brevibacterium jeotgali TaxID=1262550 RepID=A0A2H1L504_9MICO|nr:acyl-CoA dehydrogenase family protein [Brevibacterium jeotgali]TWC01407.1 alkylation response protein AidB-like acyl-CoA dehydrogenase [Brevibacterium jeotgali]SMY11988.1 Acyl-CoA dehydrogenase [Brevibacterium jeotgali]